jgi:hypothetical protein
VQILEFKYQVLYQVHTVLRSNPDDDTVVRYGTRWNENILE